MESGGGVGGDQREEYQCESERERERETRKDSASQEWRTIIKNSYGKPCKHYVSYS